MKREISKRKIKVAILGSRGIPAKYGGFESFVENVFVDFPFDNFHFYISCESRVFRKKAFSGRVTLLYVPLLRGPRIITEILYDAFSILWVSLSDISIIYLLGHSASLFLLFPRLLGKKLF
ncbi:MAG: DUF1972 domain-containing protein [Candidatus Bathyarchaeia archaeon]